MPERTAHAPAACQICGKTEKQAKLVPAAVVRSSLTERIVMACPAWSADGFICTTDLNRFRGEYVQSLLEDERGDLTSLERSVVESLARHETLSANVEAEFQKKLTIGERLADQIA